MLLSPPERYRVQSSPRKRGPILRTAYREGTAYGSRASLRLARDDGGNLLLPLHRAPGDIAAAEAVRPFDLIDRLIGARLRPAHGSTGGADIEHPAAIGEDARAVRHRAGVEDLDAFDLRGRIETLDRRALGVLARIAFRRHHHGQGRVAPPAQIEVLQLSVARGDQCRQQIRLQA